MIGDSQIVTFAECSPPISVTRGVLGIEITPSISGTNADVAEISRYIVAQNNLQKLHELQIRPGTTMRGFPDIRELCSLKALGLCARIPEKAELKLPYNMASLDSVLLHWMTGSQLDNFGGKEYTKIWVGKLRATSFALSADTARLIVCRKLVEFGDCRIGSLELDQCNKLDFRSLSRVRGLKKLWLVNPKLEDLNFVSNLESLEELVISANSLTRCDLSAISKFSRPLKIALYAMSRARKAMLFKENPNLSNCEY